MLELTKKTLYKLIVTKFSLQLIVTINHHEINKINEDIQFYTRLTNKFDVSAISVLFLVDIKMVALFGSYDI